MKKILLLTAAFGLIGTSANAQLSVSIGEPTYYQAPDYPSEHYDIHRHRHDDYWAAKQRAEREHHDDHYDHH